MLNPWVIIGLIVIWLASMTGAYFKGHSDGAIGIQTKWDAAVEKQRAIDEKKAGDAANKLENGNAKAKVVYRTITQTVDKVVEKPVYRNICLEPDGLRVANEALTGTLSAPAKPDNPMPRPTTTPRRNSVSSPAETGGDIQPILRLSAETLGGR